MIANENPIVQHVIRKYEKGYSWNPSTKNENTIAAIVMAATYFPHTCSSDHINIDNHYYLLLLCKTKLIIQNRK